MPMQLPIMSSTPRVLFADRLASIRAQLLAMNGNESVWFFELPRYDQILKTTISLCPQCLKHVPAMVYLLENRILITKRCPEHGTSQAVVENDASFYHLSNKDQWGRRFADNRVMDFPAFSSGCCGDDGCCSASENDSNQSHDFTDQMSNKTCTILVEVTNACNLACPVCYSDARGDRKMPIELFKMYLRNLIDKKGGLDSVQLTGGEALLHPEVWEMFDFLHKEKGVKRIYLPTNAVLLAKRDCAEKLTPFKDKLMVLVQFDGRDISANEPLRGANTISLRQQAIDHLQALGINMQLTMTISRGVNDADVGWVVDTALRNSMVKVAALQPVTYSGRYDLHQDPMNRLTLSDVIKAVVAQAQKHMTADQFLPIPCSHPNCGWVTLFARRFGLMMNIGKHIDLARAMNQVAYKTVLSTQEIRGIVGGATFTRRAIASLGRKLIRANDIVGVAIKPFMDRFTYDQDRISACCHHLLDTHGNPISFCEYNARLRPADSWEQFPTLKKESDALSV